MDMSDVPVEPSPRPRARHFSMLRDFHVADFFTLGNAASGIVSCFAAIRFATDGGSRHLLVACALMPLAFLFDALDGRIARWRHEHSILGRELDSLADVISFGVAPAVIAFSAGMRGAWDQAVLAAFVCCGVSRLARYNVTVEALSAGGDKVKYFEGTPIPTSILLVAVVFAAALGGHLGADLWGGAVELGPATLHPLVLLWALSGAAMVSKTLRVPKL
jgi:CDP-diacylglycerol--serine O-phosphatidyltransferase